MQIGKYNSNARFVNKAAQSSTDYDSLLAIVKFYEQGGTITKVESAKRPKKGYTVSKVKLNRG